MLTVALACIDQLTAATIMPLTVDVVILSLNRLRVLMCRFHAFAIAVFTQISIYLMALMALNCYLCIKKRNLDDKISTKKRTLCLIVRNVDSGGDHQQVSLSSVAG